VKISVITVCLNSADTIIDTVNSVASQNYKYVEHIIIDGGSTDRTLDLLASKHDSVFTLVSSKDQGLYDAMNKGIELATGDVIGFLNSDDVFYNENSLQLVASAIKGKDVVFADVEFYKDSELNRQFRYYSSASFHPGRLAYGEMPAHPTLYARRQVYESVGKYSLEYKIAADFDMVARMFAHNDFSWSYLPCVLVKMRLGGVSNRSIRNIMLLNRESRNICKRNNIKSNWLKLVFKYPAKMAGLSFFRRGLFSRLRS